MRDRHPITRYRETHGLTALALAEKAGIDRTSLCKVETGKRHRLSADACLAIEQFTKGELSASVLLAWRWPSKRSRRAPAVAP